MFLFDIFTKYSLLNFTSLSSLQVGYPNGVFIFFTVYCDLNKKITFLPMNVLYSNIKLQSFSVKICCASVPSMLRNILIKGLFICILTYY